MGVRHGPLLVHLCALFVQYSCTKLWWWWWWCRHAILFRLCPLLTSTLYSHRRQRDAPSKVYKRFDCGQTRKIHCDISTNPAALNFTRSQKVPNLAQFSTSVAFDELWLSKGETIGDAIIPPWTTMIDSDNYNTIQIQITICNAPYFARRIRGAGMSVPRWKNGQQT